MDGCGTENTTDSSKCLTDTPEDPGSTPWPPLVAYTKFVYMMIVIIIGVPGNGVIIWVQAKNRRKSSTDCLVVAMAFCDLILAGIIGPIAALQCFYSVWIAMLSAWMCRIYYYIIYSVTLASTQLLAAVAFDRYRNTCKPHSKMFDPKKARKLIIFISMNSLAVCILIFFISGVKKDMDKCGIYEGGQVVALVFNIALGSSFLGMFVIVIVSYAQVAYTLHQQYKHKARKHGITRRDGTIMKQRKKGICRMLSFRNKNKVRDINFDSGAFRSVTDNTKHSLKTLQITSIADGHDVYATTSFSTTEGPKAVDKRKKFAEKSSRNATLITIINVSSTSRSDEPPDVRNTDQNHKRTEDRLLTTNVPDNAGRDQIVANRLTLEYNRINKTSKMMFLITATYTISWILVWSSGAYSSIGDNSKTELGMTLSTLLGWAFMVNCIANPVFYIFMSSIFRERVRTLFKFA